MTLAIIRVVSLVGIVLFGALLMTTLVAQDKLERSAKAFVTSKVKAEVQDALDNPKARAAKDIYGALQERLAQETQQTKELLQNLFAERLAAFVAKLCRLDCEKESKIAAAIKSGLKTQLEKLQSALGKAKAFAQEKYDRTLDRLIRELRIFSGTNLAVFTLLFLFCFLRRDHRRELKLPAVLLLVSTSAAIFFYLFEQNWFYTILFDNYVGYGYIAYIGVTFVFLMDIFFNGARMTAAVLDAINAAVSSLLSCFSG